MRAVLQRVTKAAVLIDGQLESSIGRGICVLLAISSDDVADDIEYIVRKVLGVRMFPNLETGKRWDKSVKEMDLEILCVSQFTLYSVLKGNKLDFHRSMTPTDSLEFYQKFMDELRKAYLPERIKDGRFGALMNVQIENDGPVTVILDSKNREL